ncbi:MAG: hypothetical protein K2X02_04405 [Alphaproteobacteria bacterium]|nr:hypothetical protein [Alphaproteobacteria bacterium]
MSPFKINVLKLLKSTAMTLLFIPGVYAMHDGRDEMATTSSPLAEYQPLDQHPPLHQHLLLSNLNKYLKKKKLQR